MNPPVISSQADATHFYHGVLGPFSVLPQPWMHSDPGSAASCLNDSVIAGHLGDSPAFPLQTAAVENMSLFLLYFLLQLPWSCTTTRMPLSPSEDILGKLQAYSLPDDSPAFPHAFHHGQFEKMLSKLKSLRKTEDLNEREHIHGDGHEHYGHEHGHEDGDAHDDGQDHHGHEHDHNDGHEHHDHHDREKHRICLSGLWPGSNQTMISEVEARKLFVQVALAFGSEDRDFDFFCRDKEADSIDPDPKFFVEDILHNTVGEGHEEGTFGEDAVKTILHKLRNGEKASHDHDHGHDHDHDHDHHWRRKRFADAVEHDHDHDHDGHGEENLPGCYSAHNILEIFNLREKGNKNNDFYKICPALVQQSLTTACQGDSSKPSVRPSLTEVYGYGFLATLVITIMSLAGVLLVPCLNTNVYEKLMSSFICLGVGTMLGDGFLHLIPLSLGLHDHGSGSHDHDHNHGEESMVFVWKMFLLLVAIYVFYLVETLFAFVGQIISNGAVEPNDEKNNNSHGHSHHFVPEAQSSRRKKEENRERGMSNANPANIVNHSGNDNFGFDADPEDHIDAKIQSTGDKVVEPKEGICGVPTVSALVLIGDGIHNFVDGVALAAAFSASLRTGLSTSIAILLHELPHEFGDFAIFIASGMGYRKALGLNLISALTAFLGFFLGVQVAMDESIQLWIMAITAGMFIYVSLVNMLPEVMHNKQSRTLAGFLAQNLGMCMGVGIMLLIALFEDKLHGH